MEFGHPNSDVEAVAWLQCFNRAGQVIPEEEYDLTEGEQVIIETKIRHCRVEVRFLGKIRWTWVGPPPLYSITVFGGRHDGATRIAANEGEARACHDNFVQAVASAL